MGYSSSKYMEYSSGPRTKTQGISISDVPGKEEGRTQSHRIIQEWVMKASEEERTYICQCRRVKMPPQTLGMV
jgi:hypothetical protein